MQPTADIIVSTLRAKPFAAVTLTYGYAVDYAGARSLFEPARTVKETRNARGRVTRLIGEYADGSRILFTYSDERGPRYASV